MYQSPSPLLLSRVAESAYWAGRYLERAEGTARLIKTHADLVVDLPRDASMGWRPLLAVLGIDEDTLPVGQAFDEDSIVGLLIANGDNASSIRSSIAAAFRNLRVTRAVMPVEAVEVLNELHHDVESTAAGAVARQGRAAWLTKVIRSCQTLSAILSETMTHDDAYCFFTVGRELERADLTTRVLDSQRAILTRQVQGPLEPYLDICWHAALRSVSALQAFRRTGATPSQTTTVDFLLHDTKCPRTVEYCIIEASRWLLEIPGHEKAMAACAQIQKALADVDIVALVEGELHDFVDELQQDIGSIHDHMTATWFLPAPAEMAS